MTCTLSILSEYQNSKELSIMTEGSLADILNTNEKTKFSIELAGKQ